jgi:DNA polymerase (family 10)
VRIATAFIWTCASCRAKSFGAALPLLSPGRSRTTWRCRQIAIKKQLKLNEYGPLSRRDLRSRRHRRGVFAALDLPYIPPELREDCGEIDAARAGRLPQLIEPGTLRGDLQTQTTWTDGADTLEAMVAEAQRLGLEYMAITDHTRDLAMTGGSD